MVKNLLLLILRTNKDRYYHNDINGSLYIYNWFYTAAEWRDKQIDSILEDV
jgi:hypothetical protein